MMTSGIVYLFFVVQPVDPNHGGTSILIKDDARYYYTKSGCKADAASEAKRMFPNDKLPNDSGEGKDLDKIVAYCTHISDSAGLTVEWQIRRTPPIGIPLKDEGDED